jgi:hypothetical protein
VGQLLENSDSYRKITMRKVCLLKGINRTQLLKIMEKFLNTTFHSYPFRSPSQAPPTLYNEVDPRGLWVVICLHRAGVWALVIHIHILDLNAVLGLGVAQEDNAGIQAPFVIPSIEDCAAVKPGHPGDPVVNRAPEDKNRQIS